MIICGIDEAGRGPLIGPMVMAGVLIDEKDEAKFKAIGVKDSKLLTPFQRKDLFDKIKSISKKYKIIIVQPDEIDDAVFGKGGLNLNWLEANTSVKILNELNPEKAIVDAPSPNIKKYTEYIREKLDNKKVKLVLEHKADVNYPVVGAASILAKVTRDNEIEKIKKQIGIDFGSGYMSDPKTSEFLKKHHNKFPEIFRKSWAPYQKIADKKMQKNLSDFSKFIKE
ncbi:MAG: ribonuclease HII [Nanoarchaeota archaeon]